MKRVVDVLYGMKGYPNAANFADFKADLFANGTTTAAAIESFRADMFGSYITQKTLVSAASTYQHGSTGNVTTSTNATSSGIQGGYFKAQNTANTADVQLVGCATRVTIGGNVSSAYGIQSHLLVGTGTFTAGTANICAASFKNTFTGAMTGTCNVLLLTSEGAGTVTGEKNIMCMDATTAVTNGIMVYGTANYTNFLHFSAVAGCVSTNTATSTATHAIKISLNGTAKYIRLFDVS
jgi:hypothetical protein